MADYFSNSNLGICDDNGERNDLKGSINNPPLKKQDQILSPEDVASDALTSLFSETAGCLSNQRYIKTPIIRLSTNQTYTSIPSSSSQIGPNYQRKSIVHRHVSPHPPLLRQGNAETDSFKSGRKTRSMVFPKTGTTWRKSGTASTPDLKVDQQIAPFVKTSPNENTRRQSVYRIWTLIYNMHAMEITLDCIILVAGFIHLTAAIILAIHKNIILTIVKQEIHSLIRTTFVIVSLVLLIYSIIALYFLHKGRQKRAIHAASSLIVAIVMLFVASMQNRVETDILKNVEMNVLAMINSKTINLSTSTLDKFQTTFKCCGARGNFDWCKNEKFLKGYNFETDRTNSINLLGIYICHIPISCCASSVDDDYNLSSSISNSENPCPSYPTPWNTHRPGCLTPLKLEVYYMGTLYRVICLTTIVVLLLSMASSILLCIYP